MCTDVGDGFKIWDVKLLDSIGSSPGEKLAQRAAAVAFGATAPVARALVRGREERGVPGQAFCPLTGAGYVSAKDGDYARPIKAGLDAEELLVETFGRFDGGAHPPSGGGALQPADACRVRARGNVGDTQICPLRYAAHLGSCADCGGDGDPAGAGSGCEPRLGLDARGRRGVTEGGVGGLVWIVGWLVCE